MSRRKFLVGTFAAGALANVHALALESITEIRLSLGAPGAKALPPNYVGLSYETAQLADPSFFAADSHELISLFQTLSPTGILRLGGNSSEFCWWKTAAAQHPPELPASAHSSENWMPHSFTAIEPLAVDRLTGFLDPTGWNRSSGR